MQISGNHSLAILSAHYSPNQDKSSQQSRQQSEQQSQAQAQQKVINTQLAKENAAYSSNQRDSRRFTNIQDQNVSHRGQQAQTAYQDIAMAGEAELLGRLDVMV